MKTEERQQSIIELLRHQERVEVEELARRCKTSTATIRRDLNTLAAQGIVRRVHGAAQSLILGGYDPGYAKRASENVTAKERLAHAVVGQIKDGEVIFLDSGSTAALIAAELRERAVTVIPASLHAAQALSGGRAKVIVPGGDLEPVELSLSGPLAESSLRSWCFTSSIITPCAYRISRGILAHSQPDAQLKKLAMERAERTLVVFDASKVTQRAPLQVGAPAPGSVLLTTYRPTVAETEELKNSQLEVIAL